MKRVEGKTIIVTGGSAGSGRSACLAPAQKGAHVAVTDLREDEGRKVVDEITDAGGSAAFWHLGVTSETEMKEVYAKEKFREQLDSRHPIGHVGEPEDIAWGIVYLASDESKFVTGSELVIDRGYTAQ